MRRSGFTILLCFIAFAARADDARIEALLRQMTLEEELGQFWQYVPAQPGESRVWPGTLGGTLPWSN